MIKFKFINLNANPPSHGIVARKTDEIDGKQIERADRISLTFRTIRTSGKCMRKFLFSTNLLIFISFNYLLFTSYFSNNEAIAIME